MKKTFGGIKKTASKHREVVLRNRSDFHVSVLQLDKMLLSSLAMPLEMLHAAVSYHRTNTRSRLSLNVEPVSTSDDCQPVGGLKIASGTSVADIDETDLVIVPAMWRNPLRKLDASDPLCDWLRQRFSEGAVIMSIGTGAWLLGKAGLLDGQAATTHWHALDAFAHDFPDVRLQRDHLLTQAGRIYCAASINSGADLMIHLIGTLFNNETAAYVEQQFSPEARMSFDKRVFTEGAPQHADEAIALAQSWLHQHWQESLSVSRMSEIAGLSERQLSRRFKKATGESPGQYLLHLKCRFGKEWLKNSDLSVAEIAQLCGFSDASHFGRIFRRWQGVAPSDYRRAVRAKLFSVNSQF